METIDGGYERNAEPCGCTDVAGSLNTWFEARRTIRLCGRRHKYSPEVEWYRFRKPLLCVEPKACNHLMPCDQLLCKVFWCCFGLSEKSSQWSQVPSLSKLLSRLNCLRPMIRRSGCVIDFRVTTRSGSVFWQCMHLLEEAQVSSLSYYCQASVRP